MRSGINLWLGAALLFVTNTELKLEILRGCLISLPLVFLGLVFARRTTLAVSALGLLYWGWPTVLHLAGCLLIGLIWLDGLVEAHFQLRQATLHGRRFLIRVIGLRRLRAWVRCEVVDSDRDPSGMRRRLLEWDFAGDEAVRAVAVLCPSTYQEYLLRVPPWVCSCREAVAWTFGMRWPDYEPALES